MTTGISFYRRLFVPILALATAGCNAGLEQHADATAGQAQMETALLKRYQEDERYALRVRTDPVRGRVWMLSTSHHVRVYDQTNKRLLRQLGLPGWLVVRTSCMPDLILDRSGSAYISSNVTPSIWQVDAASFQVWVHEVGMPGREGLDFGFGALAFNGKGGLYGVAPSANSVWSIDVIAATAHMVDTFLPPLEDCTLTAQLVDRLETISIGRKP